MAKLLLITNGNPVEIELGQELTIGRGYSNLLRLDGEEISRVHAIIYRRDDAYLIRDLDSKNGIFLNDNKVAMTELKPGDNVQIGKHHMYFDPPPGFKPAEAGAQTATGSSQGAYSPRPASVHPKETPFERSQLFRGVTPGKTPAISPASHTSRDEVSLLTRAELTELCREAADKDSPAAGLEAHIMHRLVELSFDPADDQTRLPEILLRAIADVLDASSAVVVLHEPATGAFAPVAIFPAQTDVAVNRVVMREAFSNGRAVLCPNTTECGLFRDSTTVTRDRISTIISVPLAGPDGESGLLYADRKGETDPFDSAHLVSVARIARVLELHLFGAGSQVTPPQEAMR